MTKREAEKIMKHLDGQSELIRADGTWGVGAKLYDGTTMLRYDYRRGVEDFQLRDLLPMTFR